MNIFEELQYRTLREGTRRHFLKACASGLGGIALTSLIGCNPFSTQREGLSTPLEDLSFQWPHFAPKAKRIIYLHMAGAPSQLELFDYKPELEKLNGQDCPPSRSEEHTSELQSRPHL